MGRKPKFRMGMVVSWYENEKQRYGVVVRHRLVGGGTSFYEVVESDEYGKNLGRRRTLRSHYLRNVTTPNGFVRMRKGVAKTYRANIAIENRTCDCHCCVHS
jgi:hypothetical protein